MRASDDSHFDASGPVGRYWLTNGVGFSVRDGDGRMLGAVAHVVVDRRRQDAERLIVRRRGLVRRPRYVAIDPRVVESVAPDSRLFLLPPAETRVVAASRARSGPRLRGAAVAARAALVALGAALAPVVSALDGRIAAAAEATLRVSRRGAGTAAEASARANGTVRRDAPRVAAWLLARAREAGLGMLVLVRFAGRSVRSLARVLGDVAVLAGVGAAALWRRAEAALAESRSAPPEPAPEPPDVDAPEWRRDADVPLARERHDVRTARRARH